MTSMAVVLPLVGGGDTSVPADVPASQVIPLLLRERVPAETCLDIAQRFLICGNGDVYKALLRHVISSAPTFGAEKMPFSVVQAHCALAAWHCDQAQVNKTLARSAYTEAQQLLRTAQAGAMGDALPDLGLGQLALRRVGGWGGGGGCLGTRLCWEGQRAPWACDECRDVGPPLHGGPHATLLAARRRLRNPPHADSPTCSAPLPRIPPPARGPLQRIPPPAHSPLPRIPPPAHPPLPRFPRAPGQEPG